MHKEKKYIELLITLSLVCTFILHGISQVTLTLNDVLTEVYQSSLPATSAKLNKDIAAESYRLFVSQLKPQISLGLDAPNYSKTSAAITQPDGTIAFQAISQLNSTLFASATQVLPSTGGTLFATSAIQRFDDLSGDFNQYNGVPIRLGISQPLFGFNPWKYDKVIQNLQQEEALKNYNLTVEQNFQTAAQLFFIVINTQQDLDIAKVNVEINEQLLTITEERFKLGKVSQDEKLQLEIELQNAKLSEAQASLQKDRAIADLYVFMNKPQPREEVNCVAPKNLKTVMISDSELIENAKLNHPMVIAYLRSIKEAEKSLSQAKAENGFTADLNASVGFARGADDFKGVYQDPIQEQRFNLSVQVPILDWGRRSASIRLAEIDQELVENQFQIESRDLENTIRQELNFFNQLSQEIDLLKGILDNSQKRAEISNERYILGNIDITNLTLAQRERDQAQKNYIQTLSAHWLSYYRLRLLTGYDILKNQTINYN